MYRFGLLFLVCFGFNISYAQNKQEVLDQINELLIPFDSVVNKSEAENAIKAAQSAQKLAQKIENDSLYYRAIYQEESCYFLIGDYEKSGELSKKILRDSTRHNSKILLCKAYNHLGSIAAIHNQIEPSTAYFSKALIYADHLSLSEKARLMSNYGQLLTRLGKHHEALQLMLKAQEIMLEADEKYSYALVANNIGEIYREHIKDLPAAIIQYHRAATINKAIKSHYELGRNYNNLALAYEDLKSDSAAYYFDEAIKLKKSNKDTNSLIITLFNYGSYQLSKGNIAVAERFFNETRKLSLLKDLKPGIFYGLTGLAEVELAKANNTKALQLLRPADSMARFVMGSDEMKLVVWKLMVRALANEEKYKEAFVLGREYHRLYDTVNSRNNDRILNELKVSYQNSLDHQENLKLKEKAAEISLAINKANNERNIFIVIIVFGVVLLLLLLMLIRQRNIAYKKVKNFSDELNQKNEQLKTAEKELQATLELRSRILSVLGHDLRTPFASIASLLEIMHSQKLSLEDVQELAKHLSNEVDQTLTTLSNILTWSQVQLRNDPVVRENLDAENFLSEVIRLIKPTALSKKITLEVACEKSATINADKNQLRSILTNLINNAIKFSPQESTIYIAFEKHHDDQIFIVSDSGKGLTDEQLQKLNKGESFTTRGTEGEKGTGVGLSLVRDFVAFHKGQLIFDKKLPSGTLVKIILPENA